MTYTSLVLHSWLCVTAVLVPVHLWAAVVYEPGIPQLAFAAQELQSALQEAGREDPQVTLIVEPDDRPPGSFRIRKAAPTKIDVVGTDANGAMYGGIEVAEYLRLGLPIGNVRRTPLVRKRGFKMNLPWDCRTPSYCDKGSAAQNNIRNVWDVEGFWKPLLDTMARYRYNVLSLWSTHPYPNLVKVPGYEACAMPDVYRVKEELLTPELDGKIRPTPQRSPT